MQIITSKILPPLAPEIQQRHASAIEQGKGRFNLEARYCPAMDLIATFMCIKITPSTPCGSQSAQDHAKEPETYEEDDDDEPSSVDVWRFNGQQVFSIAVEAEGYDTTRIDIVDVAWRHDGKIMAILSSDNIVRIVNSFSGRVAHKFSTISSLSTTLSPKSSFNTSQRSRTSTSAGPTPSTPRCTTLTYSTHFASPSSVHRQLEDVNAEHGIELDDLLGLNVDISRLLKSKADLPKELASIDVEAFLPRLACLPPAGFGAEDLFSTRNSIDAMFHSSSKNSKSGIMDVLTIGREDAAVHLRILDSFEIGDINLSAAVGLPKDTKVSQVLNITTHPFSDKVFVVGQGQQSKGSACMLLLDLDLKFISQSPTTLPVLAAKATQLNNLLRYLKQIQNSLAREIKTAFELPGRFLRPLNEDLISQDGEGASFATVAYHTLVTGQVTGVFREWLTDVIGDRNVKRWEKSIEDCFELVRRLISEGWSPAVERCGVVTSRLAGLAACVVHGDGEHLNLGLDKKLVDELQQTIDVMAMCGEDLLREVSRELTGFSHFIKWLKWEVEAAGLEDTSERLDEMRESNDHSDLLRVLEYIDGGLVDSRLKDYIGEASSKKFAHDDSLNFYNHFKAQRKKINPRAKLPTLGELLLRMEEQCQRMFEQIAITLKQGVMVSYVAKLPLDKKARLLDAKVLCQPEFGPPQVHILGLAEDNNAITYIIIDTTGRRTKTSTSTPATKILGLEKRCEVLDARFVDEGSFMLMAQVDDQVCIYDRALPVIADGSEAWHLRHTFDQGVMEAGLNPHRLEMNGRKHRRAVAVIDADGRGYSVYDLDSEEPRDGDTMITE